MAWEEVLTVGANTVWTLAASVLMGLNTESMSPPGEEGHASIPAQLTRLDHFAHLARVLSATNLHFPLGLRPTTSFPHAVVGI